MNFKEKLSPNGQLYTYVSNSDFDWNTEVANLELISAICRLNALTMIQYAGSGHIGSSFSVIDLILAVKAHISNNLLRDKSLYFSSKGHDAPGLYAVEHASRSLQDKSIFELRRLGGLPGHPEIGIVGVPTNTGSLGMGISKAKGFIYGKKLLNEDSPNVYVILGDGELQEGQIWESMATAGRDSLDGLTVIVDANGIQSDTWVHKTSPLGDLEKRVQSYGWEYIDCDGHDFKDLSEVLKRSTAGRPKFIYAKTIKGFGVKSFQEFHPDGKFYQFHSGAIPLDEYTNAVEELKFLINYPEKRTEKYKSVDIHKLNVDRDFLPKKRADNLIENWSEILVEACKMNPKLLIFDADLTYDTGTYKVKNDLPNQYIQCGIAEQDMVSTAGTAALSGALPIVHSFASFLTTRAFEQIFNNSTENSQIIYMGFLAGLLPSAPGHSHQAVTDLTLMKVIPNMKVFEPACKKELGISFLKALEHKGPSYIRIGSFETAIESLPQSDENVLNIRIKGKDLLIISSGPTGVNIAYKAAKLLNSNNQISMASRYEFSKALTLNDLDFIKQHSSVLVIENHLPYLGTYEELLTLKSFGHLDKIQIKRAGLCEVPKNGQADEVLRFHKLSPEDIAKSLSD